LAIAQYVESHQEGAVERAARRCFRVAGPKDILDSIPKQEFVAEHLLGCIQNGLPGYKMEYLLRRAVDFLNTG
jgi:hypothetical protein